MICCAMGISEQELQAVIDSISVLGENKSAVLGAFFQHAQLPSQMSGNKQKMGIYNLSTDDAGELRAQSGGELPKTLISVLESFREEGNERAGVLSDEYILRILQGNAGSRNFSVLVFPNSLAIEVWTQAYEVMHFTNAEARLLLQLSIGLTLRQAADSDNVGYETKRTHLKAILQKTRINNQPELISGLLMQLLLYCQSQFEQPQAACPRDMALYHLNHMPKEVRLHVLTDHQGNHFRVFDMGPKHGKPLMILHPMVLPHIGEAELSALNRLQLRTFWPMRNGALDSHAEPLSFEGQVRHTIDAIEITRRTFFDRKIDLVCLISSFYFGLEYAHSFDQHVRSIFYIGACHKPNRTRSMAGRLRNGLIGLAGMNIHLMDLMVDFLGRRLQSPTALEYMLKEIYRENSADRHVLEQEYQNPESISYRFAKSIKSIRHDFFLQLKPNWEKAKWLGVPQNFIHGAQDHIHDPWEVKKLSSQLSDASFEVLKDCGQLVYMDHFEPALKFVASHLES